MSAFILLILSGTLGWLSAHFKILQRDSSVFFNRFIIYISLPALTLINVHGLKFSHESLIAISMPWLLFTINAICILTLAKVLSFSRATQGALILTAGLGNTSFIGFPLVAAFFGKEGLQTAIFIDQPGTFLILALLGIPIAVKFSGGERVSIGSLLKRVVLFPPFIALLVALSLRQVAYPAFFEKTLSALAWTLAPLALFSVGLQIHGSIKGLKEHKTALLAGLSLKLLLLPLVIFVFYRYVLTQSGVAFNVIVFEAAMAPMITASIVASERDLNPQLCNLMLAIGIPISLVTTALWYHLLMAFAAG